MTEGHKHRHVSVRHDSLLARALRAPLIWSEDLPRVDASPYPWGPYSQSRFAAGDTEQPFYLSALGVLHRWTGLTLRYPEPYDPDLTEEVLDQLTAALAAKVSSNPATWDLESGVRQVVLDTWLCATNPAILAAFLDQEHP